MRHLRPVTLLWLIGGLIVLWYWRALTAPGLLLDETTYVRAFDLVGQGRSPFDYLGYLYPALFAVVGRQLEDWAGLRATLLLLRLFNMIGAALAVWCSVAGLRASTSMRLAVGFLLVVAPPIATAMEDGNLSGVGAGLPLLALALFARAPIASGCLLGLGLTIKPAALPVLAVLALARNGGRNGFLAAVIGSLCFGLALVVLPAELPRMLAQAQAMPQALGNTSLHRIAHGFGLDLAPVIPLAVVTLLSGLYARHRRLNDPGYVALGGVAALLGLARIWTHSLVLVLPALTFGMAHAVGRWRSTRTAPAEARQRATLRLLVSTSALIAVVWGEQFAGFGAYLAPSHEGVASLFALLSLGSLLFLLSSALELPDPALSVG